jgi:hypothetical protein
MKLFQRDFSQNSDDLSPLSNDIDPPNGRHLCPFSKNFSIAFDSRDALLFAAQIAKQHKSQPQPCSSGAARHARSSPLALSPLHSVALFLRRNRVLERASPIPSGGDVLNSIADHCSMTSFPPRAGLCAAILTLKILFG